MLSLPSTVRIFLAVEPVDMRGSFNALAGHIRRLHHDPLDGHLYVFVNRRRTLMKMLFFDRSGFCILAKRLERGTFERPKVHGDETQITLDPTELAMWMEGVALDAPRRRRGSRRGAARS
jgi:transposase